MWSRLEQNKHWITLVLSWVVIISAGAALLVRHPLSEPRPSERIESQHSTAAQKSRVPSEIELFVAAREKLRKGIDPYSNKTDADTYRYPPGFLAIGELLPSSSSEIVNLFGFFTIVLWMASLFMGARTSSWRELLAIAGGIALSWNALETSFHMGQMDVLALFLAVLAARVYRRNRALSGFVLGLMPWIKLPWLLVTIPFLQTAARQGPRKLAKFFAGLFASLFFWGAGLPSLVFGPDRSLLLSQKWMDSIQLRPDRILLMPENESAWAIVSRLTGNSTLGAGITGIVCAFVLSTLIQRPVPSSAKSVDKNGGVLGWLTPWLMFTQLFAPIAYPWGALVTVGVPLAILYAIPVRRSLLGTWIQIGIFIFLFAAEAMNWIPGFSIGMRHMALLFSLLI